MALSARVPRPRTVIEGCRLIGEVGALELAKTANNGTCGPQRAGLKALRWTRGDCHRMGGDGMGAGPMGWPVIEKARDGWAVEPNLID